MLARNQQTSVHPQVGESLFNFGLLGKKVGPFEENPHSGMTVDQDMLTCHARMVDELQTVLPGAGQYVNEGDPSEKNWQQSFWGDNYERLLQVKKSYYPENTFQCHQCVGSEGNVGFGPSFETCYKY